MLVRRALAFAFGAAAAACMAPPVSTASGPGSDPAAGNDDGNAPASSSSSSSTSPGAAPPAAGEMIAGPVGVVVIDEQQVFFDTAASRNPAAAAGPLMDRSAQIFGLAKAKSLPFFITFEATTTGDHALPAALRAVLPANARSFVKTTFAATSQPDFAHAIATGGVPRVLVIGAETDVCVLQTILGLRRGGHEVFALKDAIFTEERNDAPALRRYAQAGVQVVDLNAATNLLQTLAPTPSAGPATAPIVKSFEIGILLHAIDHLGDADVNASPKRVRLRELLTVSEWFQIPLFAADPARTLAALPSDLRGILTRPIQPLASRPANISQLAVVGGHAGLAAQLASVTGDVFLIEDALVGGGAADLAPLEAKGAVPSTYKTLWYELTKSVDDAGWPSQAWVQRGSTYWDRTMAPEELPPLAPE